ncbi:Phosphoglucosamine mutase, partial [Camellia lanceoleosa]
TVVESGDGGWWVAGGGGGGGGWWVAYVICASPTHDLSECPSASQFLELTRTLMHALFEQYFPPPSDSNHKLAMEAITQSVFDNNVDLGIIFDADVDRSAAVDSCGRELNQNRLIALMSAIHPRTTVVIDSVTSNGLTTFIEKKLGKQHRFKRGYKNVIDEAIHLNSVGKESHLAIETSGHGALKENHWLDDGAYLMVKLLNKLASAKASGVGGGSKVLNDLVDSLEERAVTVEFRLTIDQSHPDLKGGYATVFCNCWLKMPSGNSGLINTLVLSGPSRIMERLC